MGQIKGSEAGNYSPAYIALHKQGEKHRFVVWRSKKILSIGIVDITQTNNIIKLL